MVGENGTTSATRRRVLRKTIGALGIGALSIGSLTGATAQGSNHLVIAGGSPEKTIYYEFSVTGSLSPSERSGSAPIEDRHVTFDDRTPGRKGDSIRGSTAQGAVAGGADAYQYSGRITSFNTGPDADVYVNGRRANLGSLPRHLVIFGGSPENVSYYEVSVSGDLIPSGSSGDAPIEDEHVTFDDLTLGREGDSIFGSTAQGAIAGGGDAYRFSGEITAFDGGWGADVYLDGRPW